MVLVDSATASGAGIVAGSLRFNDRALLIGERTPGNALIQVLHDLKDREAQEHSSLKLSIATVRYSAGEPDPAT